MICAPGGDFAIIWSLVRMAVMLHARYERFGAPELLEEAIETSRTGLNAAPEDCDGDEKANLLEGYANELQSRSKRFGSIEDLGLSIDLTMKAIAAAPNDESRVTFLNNLSNRFEHRFDQTDRLEDLKKSILVMETTLELAIRYNPPVVATFQHNLGVKLAKLHERDAEAGHLPHAIHFLGQAILTVETGGGAVPPGWLNNFSGAIGARYRRTRDEEDLGTAIRFGS